MHFHIHAVIAHYGYAGVFLVLMLEMIGIPFPAETTLTISGLEWTNGVFAFWPLLAAAVLGNVVGSTIAFGIGSLLGRSVILRFGRLVRITEEHIDAANRKLARYEFPVVIAAKFIAGIRILVPYLAGINRMSFLRFTILNTIGAILWAALFIGAGRAIEVTWSKYHSLVMHHIALLTVALGLTVVGLAMYRLSRRRRAKRETLL